MGVFVEMSQADATPLLSVLIVSWNSWDEVNKCLQSITASGFSDMEIVVIDNASTDGSVANLRRHYPQVTVHENLENLGHTRAVNQGFGRVRGEYVLLLDSDTELGDGMVETLMSFMRGRPDVSAVAPRTYNTDGTIQESARSLPSAASGLFGRQSLLTRLFPKNRFSCEYLARDKSHAKEPFQVEQIGSACMLFRRSLVDEVGPWDEGYFGYWVDTDWYWQLKRHGKKVYCVPQVSVVHHEGNRAGRKKHPSRIWMFHSGAYRFYRKRYTWGVLDPRAIFAGIALTLRAVLLIALNQVRPADRGETSSSRP
jgi:GT2 family glycosyltransferase